MRDFTRICLTWLAGMKGDSPSPSWDQDELRPAEQGNEDEVGKRSGSFVYFPYFHCPLSMHSSIPPPTPFLLLLQDLDLASLSHFSPSHPSAPPFFFHFAMIDDHDALLLDSLLTSWRGSGQWAAPPNTPYFVSFYVSIFIGTVPLSSHVLFSLSVTCLSSHLLFNTIALCVSQMENLCIIVAYCIHALV